MTTNLKLEVAKLAVAVAVGWFLHANLNKPQEPSIAAKSSAKCVAKKTVASDGSTSESLEAFASAEVFSQPASSGSLGVGVHIEKDKIMPSAQVQFGKWGISAQSDLNKDHRAQIHRTIFTW